MAAPSRESTGRLVTDSTFTLPYAYPSSADYSIESQFDDVPGPYRRQRGTRAALDALASAGADRVSLEVREDNAPARALYERAGYRRHGRVADYYEDGTAAIGFFLQFLFYMLTVIATPLAPVMRMLTSNEGVEDGEIGGDAAPAPPPPPPQPASKPAESGAPAADEAGTVV